MACRPTQELKREDKANVGTDDLRREVTNWSSVNAQILLSGPLSLANVWSSLTPSIVCLVDIQVR